MKFMYSILFVLLTFFSCEKALTDLHNGKYIFIAESDKKAQEELINIKGDKATLRMHSLFNRSKLSKSTYLCLHYPNRVDLYISKQRPISIPVNKDGNLIWDEKVFVKQIPLIIQPKPIPEASLESQE